MFDFVLNTSESLPVMVSLKSLENEIWREKCIKNNIIIEKYYKK